MRKDKQITAPKKKKEMWKERKKEKKTIKFQSSHEHE